MRTSLASVLATSLALTAGCAGDEPPGPAPSLVVRAAGDSVAPLAPGDELALALGPAGGYLWRPGVSLDHVDCDERRDCRFTATVYVSATAEILCGVSNVAFDFEVVSEHSVDGELVMLFSREPPHSWAELDELDGAAVTFELFVEDAAGRTTDLQAFPLTLRVPE